MIEDCHGLSSTVMYEPPADSNSSEVKNDSQAIEGFHEMEWKL